MTSVSNPAVQQQQRVAISMPVAQPVPVQPRPINQQGSYAGRAIRWLNNTPGGNLLKASLGTAAAVLMLCSTASLVVKAVVLTIFGVAAIATGVGAPVGLAALAIAALMVGGAYLTLNASQACMEFSQNHFNESRRLSAQGL